ncbi:CHC2 zinc finger [Mucilaginibacter pineti]|uniref:CHC2 zinc finger n=1 Tax=Mucilaginibacter pineti TaxID=1391627 RepID=A0A1G7IGZ3_9SPHI|nr:toprim domain-containing protein [Mucilaginibacter pineti]SDF11895.1 CHC2 zinc finger [Mucilaginibacter pineti]
MNKYIDATALKEQVSLVDLLSRLGHEPVKTTGGQHKYHSMIRDGDSDPSFSVNPETDEWYDFGLPGGGDVISFGQQYWKNLTFSEVLNKIADTCAADREALARQTTDRPPRPRIRIKIPTYHIFAVKPLGNNPILETFLKGRGVWDVAADKLSEVYYYITDANKQRRNYFAIGWQNELGSWEVRTAASWKGCLGTKALTRIQGDTDRLVLFEGYIDYLSWLKTADQDNLPTVLVLNTTALAQQAANRAAAYKEVTVFFDHDQSGRDATALILKANSHAKDGSGIYEGHNDYNEKVMAAQTKCLPWEEPHVYQKMLATYRR